MHELITWSGFVGAWLLFAGPLFQAAVELDEQGDQRVGMSEASRAVGGPEPLSPWWWLLPPVAYVLQVRRQRAYRSAVFAALSPVELESFVEFTSVATGWSMVAAGAFFIALKETYELVEVYEWPGWVLPIVALVMLALSAANTVVRIRRAHQMLGEKRRAAAASAGVA